MGHSFGAAILAAGQGTRLKMDIAKPMVPLFGKKMIDFPLNEVIDFFKDCGGNGLVGVVTGHDREAVEDHISMNYIESNDSGIEISLAYQKKQLGTADALLTYINSNPRAKENDFTLVICSDTPLIRKDDLHVLFDRIIEKNLDGVAATFIESNPKGYGRIVRNIKNDIGFHIVEEKDADCETRKITEVNSGLYILRTSYILEHLDKIDCRNKSGEFYLTDLFTDECNVEPIIFDDAYKFIGVNTLEHLEEVAIHLRQEKCKKLMQEGVRFYDSASVYIDWDVTMDSGVVVYPHVIVEGNSAIGKNSILGPGAIITNSLIGSEAHILAYSCLENVEVRDKAQIGPFARLRPGSVIGESSKIGNFVEVKKSILDKDVKVSHLSYIGDAEIGEASNIGCGFVTCNYDGANKHLTKIGKNSFIGSDSQTIAPITIGDGCYVASGSTITHNMPDGSFAIARSKQVTKDDMAHRFLKKKK